MSDDQNIVRDHYEAETTGGDLVSRAKALLAVFGDGPLTNQQLSVFDQFHMRGLPATLELAELAAFPLGGHILDAGSGLGGPSRYLAESKGCIVTGIDLSPSFVEIATYLANRTGLSDRVSYVEGSATELPFADASFDGAWTQHVVMNIKDRPRLYREIRRVLKPGSRFAFYDVIAADGNPDIHFPVPWSMTAETSRLLSEEATRDVMQFGGLNIETWDDVTAKTLDWIHNAAGAAPNGPGLAGLYGPEFIGQAVGNFGRNLKEGLMRLVMGVARAV